jgi:hypothetical protein
MKAKKNEITGISFIRQTDDIDKKLKHKITLHLTGKIPPMGYGSKELIKMLNRYEKISNS